MTIPIWFRSSTAPLDEQELQEQLEYEQAQLEMLKMDVANTEVRMALLQDKLHACL